MSEKSALKSASRSRQKSCNACVKAKRGCDKRQPVCSRCEEKRTSCIYSSTKRTQTDTFQDCFDFNWLEADISWPGLTALSSPITFVDQTTAGLDAFIDPFLTFGEDSTTSPSNMQLINSVEDQLDEPRSIGPQSENQTIGKFDYAQMADICTQYEPWHAYDPNTKAHFIIQSLRGYPATFAKDNHTSWMHRHLYKDQMPSSIQFCFTVCTLYSNMTISNKTSVFRVLCESLNELKRRPFVNTPQEKLARAQALFLFQIICVFDGDLTLRSNADRDMPLLQNWLDDLCKVRKNVETSGDMNSTGLWKDPSAPRSWEWWIFKESVRRTIVMAYTFIGLWNLMCKNNNDVFFGAWKDLHCWTVSRPLWEAPSSFDFFQTWKDMPHHVVGNFEFESFLKTGRAEDVDDFTKVLIVAYMGLDETKQWFLERNSSF